ncbi:hypothetical protein ACFW04_001310 [Cataglyphis niger]
MHSTIYIEKLFDGNYEAWKIQMKSVLIYNDLWDYTSEEIARPETEVSASNWTTKDEKALALSFKQKINLLEDEEIEIPAELQSIMLLSSLPEDYENFCVAIKSRDQIPTVNFIKGKLIEKEARRQGNSNKKESSISAKSLPSKKKRWRQIKLKKQEDTKKRTR